MKLFMPVTALMVLFVSVVWLGGHAVAQQPRECARYERDRKRCVEWDASSGVMPIGSRTRPGPPPACRWVTVDRDLIIADDLEAPPSDVTGVWQTWSCDNGSGPQTARWVPLRNADELARASYGRLEATVAEPEVASNPPPDKDAVVGFPVFVRVTNWAPVTVGPVCAGSLCVTLRGEPDPARGGLVYTPGELESERVHCVGPGRLYDPNGGSAREQAAHPKACTWTYRYRTGAAGRPHAWPASVAVRWVVSWQANNGETGTLTPLERTTSVPRSVDEVQTVVRSRGEERR